MAHKYTLQPTYGKQSVPVFKVTKSGPAGAEKHSITDMMIQIMLEGDVSDSWLRGLNHQIVPTETQKNTCYALALKTDFSSVEDYALALGTDMLRRHTHLSAAKLKITSRTWDRAVVDGKPHNHVFTSSPSPIQSTTYVEVHRSGKRVVRCGLKSMKLMKTTQSGFDGFIRDEYTNLEPVGAGSKNPNRIMCTEMEADWTFSEVVPDFNKTNEAIKDSLLSTFGGPTDTGKFSKSLQETAYNMATTVLDKFHQVTEVSLTTPNIHFYRWDGEQFGLPNPNYVFQSTDCHTSASGRICTVVSRKRNAKL